MLTTPDLLTELQTGAYHRFSDGLHPSVPRFATGVYTLWLDDTVFAYAGMAGRSITPGMPDSGKTSGLASRLSSHASGRRSGDQFCVYIADRLVMPGLTRDEIEAIGSGLMLLDAKLRDFIRRRMGYRFAVLPGAAEARSLEATLRAGDWPAGPPLLNQFRSRT